MTRPGFGGAGPAPCGTNSHYLTPALLFQFQGTKPLAALPSIPPCPSSFLNDPVWAAFNARGELFIANRHGNEDVIGSIARFVFDQDGNPYANGVIIHPSLRTVHGLVFSRTGELFAANYLSRTITRFRFDRYGAAIPNGTMNVGFNPLALAFNRRNELFVTTGDFARPHAVVFRFVFDRNGTAIPSGSFAVPEGRGNSCCQGLAFSPRGELFVVDHVGQLIFPFLFDSGGNPIANGSFFAIGRPIGLAFSPPGELFVSGHNAGGIARFRFDANGNPVSNGFVPTPPLGGIAIFP